MYAGLLALLVIRSNPVLRFLCWAFIGSVVVDFKPSAGRFLEIAPGPIRGYSLILRPSVVFNGMANGTFSEEVMIPAVLTQFADLAFHELSTQPEFLPSYNFVAGGAAAVDFRDFFVSYVGRGDGPWREQLDARLGRWYVDDRLDLMCDQLNWHAREVFGINNLVEKVYR